MYMNPKTNIKFYKNITNLFGKEHPPVVGQPRIQHKKTIINTDNKYCIIIIIMIEIIILLLIIKILLLNN